MTGLLGPHAVETGDEQLKEASVDRFRKYTAVHGIYDGPIPAAIVYPSSTEDVAAVLRFAGENLVNVVPRTGGTATEGGLETVVEDSLVVDGSRMNAILSVDPVDMMATAQCGAGLQDLEAQLPAGLFGPLYLCLGALCEESLQQSRVGNSARAGTLPRKAAKSWTGRRESLRRSGGTEASLRRTRLLA